MKIQKIRDSFMISDQELLYGAAFSQLFQQGNKILVKRLSEVHLSMYLIETDNSKSAILFKISKKPKSTWSFTLSSQEQSSINSFAKQCPSTKVFLVFICHKDGICCVSKNEIWNILDLEKKDGQHISICRKPYGSYHVSSSKKINRSIPQNDWPYIISESSSHESNAY